MNNLKKSFYVTEDIIQKNPGNENEIISEYNKYIIKSRENQYSGYRPYVRAATYSDSELPIDINIHNNFQRYNNVPEITTTDDNNYNNPNKLISIIPEYQYQPQNYSDSPILFSYNPSPSPSFAPAVSAPSPSPSSAPGVSVPSPSPSSAPGVSVPSPSPSSAPGVSVPSPSPSSAPGVSVPSPSPSSAPDVSVPSASPSPSSAPDVSVPSPSPSSAPDVSVSSPSPSSAPDGSVSSPSPSSAPDGSVPSPSPSPSSAPGDLQSVLRRLEASIPSRTDTPATANILTFQNYFKDLREGFKDYYAFNN
jgi:hypothetical protein